MFQTDNESAPVVQTFVPKIDVPAPLAPSAPLARVVAIVGCDGTGKSTLTADLLASLRHRGPVERRYMGLISGETGDKIKKLSFIGIRVERYFASRARRALDMEKKVPGTFSAIVMYMLSLWRASQLRRLIRLSQSGTLIIVDRYPQAEIPGFDYDGPGLSIHRANNRLVRKLAVREQKLYEWMAEQKPVLIIRLGIDAETAHARKPDHHMSELRNKVKVMARIGYNGGNVHEIDARMPYPRVLESALTVINTTIPL